MFIHGQSTCRLTLALHGFFRLLLVLLGYYVVGNCLGRLRTLCTVLVCGFLFSLFGGMYIIGRVNSSRIRGYIYPNTFTLSLIKKNQNALFNYYPNDIDNQFIV